MTGLVVLFRITVIVFVSEGVIMYGFSLFEPFSHEFTNLADAFLLVILSSPLIFVFAIKPYVLDKTMELVNAKEDAETAKADAEKNEATLSIIFDSITDGIIFTDTERRIISASKGMEKTFGYTLHDLVGKTTSVLYESEEEYENQGRIRFNLTAEEKPETYEVIYQRKNGEIFVGETLGLVIRDFAGVIQGYMGVIRDISERKKYEIALRESEENFKALSDASYGGIIIHKQGVILECNNGLSEITGFSRQELIGMDGFKLISPETLKIVLANIKRGYDQRYDVEGIRKDGTRYPLAIKGKNVSHKGRDIRVIEFRDVTEDYAIQEDLRKALVDAERANQSKSEFLASMSHELRTPLNAVLGFAQMLQFDPKNPLTPSQQKHTEYIIEGGNHLLELVNEILDLAQIEAGQQNLTLSDVEANEVVMDCVSLIAPLIEKRNIKIIDQFSGGSSALLFTDRTRLKQILINLLSNATKFNRDGGTITIDGQITDYGYLRLSVTDTGVGIAEKDYPSVFSLFHRLGSDPMVAREGTGIGLTVTKSLVERMAGRIGFKSEEGTGSTFWFDLPLASNDDALIWTDAINIGVDAIDKDHQFLVSLLNRLTRRSISDADVDEIIGELIDYTEYHFAREEAIMEVCAYPDIEKHRAIHQRLIASVRERAEAWQREKNQESLIQFRKFLKNWLFDHILKKDTKITFSAKGKKMEIRKALADLE